MKKKELKIKIVELEKEVERLNSVIEGMKIYANIAHPTSYPFEPSWPSSPYTPSKPYTPWNPFEPTITFQPVQICWGSN